MEIQYVNRENSQVEVEKVYGLKAVKWMYNSWLGKLISRFVSRPFFSKFYGSLQNTSYSKRKIGPFIRNFEIQIDEFVPEEGMTQEDPYSSFNQFFIRKFKDGARKIESEPSKMPAFCEARYFGYDSINSNEKIPVKGEFLTPNNLLADERWGMEFQDGPLLLARLCPVDYHRFHFPDDGKVMDYYRISGHLHSVNPIALHAKQDIFSTNERQVTILDTENFGRMAYVEVGATCVGRIVQSYDSKIFSRGDEKGYFLFGGSTVIVIGQKGAWAPTSDIVENTKKGIETYIKLGAELGIKS